MPLWLIILMHFAKSLNWLQGYTKDLPTLNSIQGSEDKAQLYIKG